MADPSAAKQITSYIEGLSGWRGKTVARLRKLIGAAAPNLVEEWKWNTPVWSHNGNVVAVGAFSDHVKINFFKGASLDDPKRLFNAGLEAKATRAIDVHEGDKLNEAALKELVRSAAALNAGKQKSATKKKKSQPRNGFVRKVVSASPLSRTGNLNFRAKLAGTF
jgi:hypothetical protein